MFILLVPIYFIVAYWFGGYCWLLYSWLLMFILLVPIYSFAGYWFGGYLWLFKVKLPYVINSY